MNKSSSDTDEARQLRELFLKALQSPDENPDILEAACLGKNPNGYMPSLTQALVECGIDYRYDAKISLLSEKAWSIVGLGYAYRNYEVLKNPEFQKCVSYSTMSNDHLFVEINNVGLSRIITDEVIKRNEQDPNFIQKLVEFGKKKSNRYNIFKGIFEVDSNHPTDSVIDLLKLIRNDTVLAEEFKGNVTGWSKLLKSKPEKLIQVTKYALSSIEDPAVFFGPGRSIVPVITAYKFSPETLLGADFCCLFSKYVQKHKEILVKDSILVSMGIDEVKTFTVGEFSRSLDEFHPTRLKNIVLEYEGAISELISALEVYELRHIFSEIPANEEHKTPYHRLFDISFVPEEMIRLIVNESIRNGEVTVDQVMALEIDEIRKYHSLSDHVTLQNFLNTAKHEDTLSRMLEIDMGL